MLYFVIPCRLMIKSKRFKDLSKLKIGRWTVSHCVGKSKRGTPIWRCDCECGNSKDVLASNLRAGCSKSCGCLIKEITSKRSKTHGERNSPEYATWQGMKNRCLNQGCDQFHNYGGRGIKVCERWSSFSNFLSDMGRKPSAKHSIDRLNVDGDYCPDNCRWATSKEQQNNRRNNKLLTVNGEVKNASEWAVQFSISPHAIYERLKRGWGEEEAVTTPLDRRFTK